MTSDTPMHEEIKKTYKENNSITITPTCRPRDIPRIRAVCYLAALGLSVKDISVQLGMPETRVSAIIKSSGGGSIINDAQEKIFLKNFPGLFERMVPKAANTLYEVMTDNKEKGSARIAAASEVLDRALGKSTQKIQHENLTIRELFEQLDKLNTIKTIEAESKTVNNLEEEEKPCDNLVEWTEKNLA